MHLSKHNLDGQDAHPTRNQLNTNLQFKCATAYERISSQPRSKKLSDLFSPRCDKVENSTGRLNAGNFRYARCKRELMGAYLEIDP